MELSVYWLQLLAVLMVLVTSYITKHDSYCCSPNSVEAGAETNGGAAPLMKKSKMNDIDHLSVRPLP